jgi:DNA gyrase/topoisomerase IV subunit B
LSFFNNWPELYENKIVCRCITPIIIAYKDNDVQKFYKLEDFKKKEKSLKGYKLKYAKGLGSLSNEEYKDMMRNPVLYYFKKDDCADLNLKLWFNKGIAKERKDTMKNLV